jgi:propanol-preferring alcohol dehydrogenase
VEKVNKAWALNQVVDLKSESTPLQLIETEIPTPRGNELLVKISCCGVCHTELDEIEGRTPPPKFPVTPGHQVIGFVQDMGPLVTRFQKGDRVGIAWIYSACGTCEFCKAGLENLCPDFKGTGRDANGGYAQYMCIEERFACSIPKIFSDSEAAPLLCAGAIGHRALRLSGLQDGEVLGLTGFGASGHLVLKTAHYMFPSSKILVFARSKEEREFALTLGATWAGEIQQAPPFLAHAIIDTTPAWAPVISSLEHLRAGGRLVINAIRKDEADKDGLMMLSYSKHLWMEKEIKSVANITTKDVADFLKLAAEIPIRPSVQTYAFHDANKALFDLKHKPVVGAKVLLMETPLPF